MIVYLDFILHDEVNFSIDKDLWNLKVDKVRDVLEVDIVNEKSVTLKIKVENKIGIVNIKIHIYKRIKDKENIDLFNQNGDLDFDFLVFKEV